MSERQQSMPTGKQHTAHTTPHTVGTSTTSWHCPSAGHTLTGSACTSGRADGRGCRASGEVWILREEWWWWKEWAGGGAMGWDQDGCGWDW